MMNAPITILALLIVAAIVPGASRLQLADATAPRHAAIKTPTPGATAGKETIRIYFTPLASTTMATDIGLGEAYHMAIVYTDAQGTSFGASGGPSNLKAAQTPRNALLAMLDDAECKASAFGKLIADPHNNTAFVIHSAGDIYTRDAEGRPYPHKLVARGNDLSAQWRTIVRTYAKIGRRGFTYSPIEQNSNSLAATSLKCAGLAQSHERYFVPGAFTTLDDCRS